MIFSRMIICKMSINEINANLFLATQQKLVHESFLVTFQISKLEKI